MAKSENHQRYIKPLARESLDVFSRIAEAAQSRLASSSSGSGSNTFANINPFTSPKAVQNISEIRRTSHQAYHRLTREPSIARVVASDETGKKTTYYICRAAPVRIDHARIKLASYRSPIGRLAEFSIGENFWERNGEEISVKILENAKFQPMSDSKGWDSCPTKLEGESHKPLEVKSLREFLRDEPIDPTLLESLLDAERKTENVSEWLGHEVIAKAELRDQAILDKFQGKLFRLPLNSRILILGAPGTGKTTTLIRRLGQKLDVQFLNESEKQIAGLRNPAAEDQHSRSWIMFTPTELLKLYIKEAFNREDIPAPDERINTWDEFRNDIARNKFGILRSASNRSSYVMKNSTEILKEESKTDPTAWFTDFDQWQKSIFLQETNDSVKILIKAPSDIAQIGKRLSAILDTSEGMLQSDIFVSFAKEEEKIREIVNRIKETSDRKIRRTLNLEVNKNHSFLDDFASFIERLPASQGDPEDQEADIEEEEDEPNQLRIGHAAAVAYFMRTIRAQARARARNRNITKTSRTYQLVEWLGDRTLPDQDLKEMGRELLLQSALRRFVNPVRRYINGILRRYRRFRRERQKENRWYCAEGFIPTDIHPLEVDIVLLAIIHSTNDLIKDAPLLSGDNNSAHETLVRLQNLHRTQILIDEATDFSPIQLACMAAIARPGVKSIFACGDFNQRVTNWGTRSMEQMKWAIADIQGQNISIPYRQTLQMHNFSRKIIDLSGDDATKVEFPDSAGNKGVAPVLATQMSKRTKIVNWLAQRIQEIERSMHQLPSIAVFVNSEDEVRPITSALNDELIDQNIRVIACLEGRILGQDEAVRVFNVEHIKGLEFEAVFFVGIDRLAEKHPDMFNKYLYVGATRAATYLGITCEKDLPAKMKDLRKLFKQKWQ